MEVRARLCRTGPTHMRAEGMHVGRMLPERQQRTGNSDGRGHVFKLRRPMEGQVRVDALLALVVCVCWPW